MEAPIASLSFHENRVKRLLNREFQGTISVRYQTMEDKRVKNISQLDVVSMSLDDSLAISQCCPLLKKLRVQWNISQTQIVSNVTKIASLEEVDIDVKHPDQVIKCLKILSNLKYLKLWSQGMFGSHIQLIAKSLPNLVKLQIGYTKKITQDVITSLKSMKNLESLGFYWVQIPDHLFQFLCQILNYLKQISVVGSRFSSDSCILSILKLKNLSSLNLNLTKINSETKKKILNSFPNLQQLNICSNQISIAEETLPFQGKIKCLVMDSCHLNDNVLVKLSQKIQSLQCLSIDFNCDITILGIGCLAKHHPNLTKLSIGGCKKLGDQSLVSICTGIRGLKELQINMCNFSDRSLIYLSKLRDLTVLKMLDLNQAIFMRKLIKNLVNLQVLFRSTKKQNDKCSLENAKNASNVWIRNTL